MSMSMGFLYCTGHHSISTTYPQNVFTLFGSRLTVEDSLIHCAKAFVCILKEICRPNIRSQTIDAIGHRRRNFNLCPPFMF